MASALVMSGSLQTHIGGMTLTERAVRLAHRAQLSPIRVCGDPQPPVLDVSTLRAEGIPVEPIGGDIAQRLAIPEEDVVVIGPDLLFGPAVLTALFHASASTGAVTCVFENDAARLLFVPAASGPHSIAYASLEEMTRTFAAARGVRDIGPVSCRQVHAADAAGEVERDFIRQLNGRESYFTKKIRRFSVPLSSQLARLGLAPAAVTMTGLVLAMASAWCVAQGQYAWGVLGGLLYYASMVFDCSDGEVARLTLRDSRSGAWLETVVDYTTYLLLLIALVAAVRTEPGAEPYLRAATLAFVGSSVVVVVAVYLRQRVAGADPGQFDEASASAMVQAPALHRFARWGRQWIKRSTIAHLVVALALVDRLPWLLYLWAFGATVAAVVIAAVMPFVVRRVSVKQLAIPRRDAR